MSKVNYERQKILEKVECKYGYYRQNPLYKEFRLDINSFTWEQLKQITDVFVEEKKIIPETVYFNFDTNYGYYDSIDTDFYIHGTRWETDDEMGERVFKEEKAVAKQKEAEVIRKKQKADREKAEYERLKKKFGDK